MSGVRRMYWGLRKLGYSKEEAMRMVKQYFRKKYKVKL